SSCRPKLYPPIPSALSPEEIALPGDEEEEKNSDKEDQQPEIKLSLKELQVQMETAMQALQDWLEHSLQLYEEGKTHNHQPKEKISSRQSTQTIKRMSSQPCIPSAPSATSLCPPPYAEPSPLQHESGSRWSGIMQGSIIEGDWHAAGAIALPIIAGNPNIYQQHDWKVLQQVKRTVKERGIKSEAGQITLDWIHTVDVKSPHDCRNLARMFLTPSQQIWWEREWYHQATLEAARHRGPNDQLNGITAEMITGRGRCADMQKQLNYPLALHHLAASTARQAYSAAPGEGPSLAFTNIKQGMTEPYTHFINRLTSALCAQPDMDEAAKQSMFKMLAFENANPKTKSLLATLPISAEVGDMIELANRTQDRQQGKIIAQAVSSAIAPTTSMIAAAVQKL
ncbi:GAK9 protein, partial [Calcarius ornatus]|nr:GAK9 protein [Calcarius ornatus]